MILLIDIGNTRIKWATLSVDQLGEQHAFVYRPNSAQLLRTHLLSLLAAPPERVVVANVGGDAIAQLLTDTVVSDWRITPEFVRSTASAAGVRTGYAQPEKLGVDRWLAAIAAHRIESGAACVASVGTALTVDAIDLDGQHLGGIIVPGPDLMIASLLSNTSDIASHALGGSEGTDIFADNTLAAIQQGATHALAAVVERAYSDLRSRLRVEPTLFLTGGACGRITPALRVPFRLVPDLVLQGLAAIASDSKSAVATNSPDSSESNRD